MVRRKKKDQLVLPGTERAATSIRKGKSCSAEDGSDDEDDGGGHRATKADDGEKKTRGRSEALYSARYETRRPSARRNRSAIRSSFGVGSEEPSGADVQATVAGTRSESVVLLAAEKKALLAAEKKLARDMVCATGAAVGGGGCTGDEHRQPRTANEDPTRESGGEQAGAKAAALEESASALGQQVISWLSLIADGQFCIKKRTIWR